MSAYQEIKSSLRQLYLGDSRPWLVGYSGGKDSTMVASVVFDAILSVPIDQRKKPIAVLCTDTRVEAERSETPRGQGGNPAIVETIEATLARMRKFAEQNAPWKMANADFRIPNASSLDNRHSALDTSSASTPSCGHSRFGCWTCTVVERDKPSPTRRRCRVRQPSEGLLAAGDERMEHLIGFRETLLEYQDPDNGKRDVQRKNGSAGPGRLTTRLSKFENASVCVTEEVVVDHD